MHSHGEALRIETKDDELVNTIQSDYRNASLDFRTLQLLDFARKITMEPQSIQAGHLQQLRDHSITEEMIFDTVIIAAYFNFINRISESFGVELDRPND